MGRVVRANSAVASALAAGLLLGVARGVDAQTAPSSQGSNAQASAVPQLRGPLVNEVVADAVRRERAQQPNPQAPNNNWKWFRWVLVGAAAWCVAWVIIARAAQPG